MKKEEIKNLMGTMTRRRTATLAGIKATLIQMKDERRLTKKMYFWPPRGSADGRRAAEAYRNITIDCNLRAGADIEYTRDYEESCRHVYASDDMIMRLDGETKKVTTRDLDKIIAAIDEIIARREKRAAKAA